MVHWIASGTGGVLGAAVGSYLATVLLRWPRDISATQGRSRCDTCGMRLGPASLIPILSYVLQRGRCRGCGTSIAVDHPAMELAGAMIGGLSAAFFVTTLPLALASAMFGWTLLLLAAFDLRYFWLPDRLTLPLAALGILVSLGRIGPAPVSALIGAIAGFSCLWAVGRVYRSLRGQEGLGGGDPKLFGAIGAWVGWDVLPKVLLAAACLGLAATAVSYLMGKSLNARTRLPLGSLLAMAAWPLWLVAQLD